MLISEYIVIESILLVVIQSTIMITIIVSPSVVERMGLLEMSTGVVIVGATVTPAMKNDDYYYNSVNKRV